MEDDSRTTGGSHMNSAGKTMVPKQSNEGQASGTAGYPTVCPARCRLMTLWDTVLGQKDQTADPEETHTRVQLESW